MNVTQLVFILLFQCQCENIVTLSSLKLEGYQFLNKAAESLFNCLQDEYSCITNSVQFVYRYLEFIQKYKKILNL